MFDYQQLKIIEVKNLGRQDLGSSLQFDEILPNLEKIKAYLSFFEGRENALTNIEKEPIINIYSGFVESVKLIQDFAVSSSESHEQTQERRMAILKKISALHKESNEKALPLITHLKFDDTKIQETITGAQNKLAQIDNQFITKIQNFDNNVQTKISEFDTQIQKARETLSEAQQIKAKAENFSVEKLVEKYGTIFSTQAEKNRNIAIASLFAFAVSIIVLISLTFYWFNPLIQKLTSVDNIKITLEYILTNLIFRLTLLGMASMFVKESLKNFNVNMHLYNLNRHRQNALLSFETLISNIKDSHETRDAIIKEIARTIYANQDDGYLRTDRKAINPTQIIELIKILK